MRSLAHSIHCDMLPGVWEPPRHRKRQGGADLSGFVPFLFSAMKDRSDGLDGTKRMVKDRGVLAPLPSGGVYDPIPNNSTGRACTPFTSNNPGHAVERPGRQDTAVARKSTRSRGSLDGTSEGPYKAFRANLLAGSEWLTYRETLEAAQRDLQHTDSGQQ